MPDNSVVNLFKMARKTSLLLLLFLLLFLISCYANPSISSEEQDESNFSISSTLDLPPSSTSIQKLSTTVTPLKTKSQTASATQTATTESTATASPTTTPTTIITPTFAILRGEVNVAHVSCFYGPHKSYLYKYGLVGGSNLEIIGRNVDTDYIQIRAIGGTNPCWMNSKWMNIKGDISAIEPIDPLSLSLPQSPYYGPLSGVVAQRENNIVSISWNYLNISPGKDSEQEPYLVEAWVCLQGQIKFIPVGVYQNTVTLEDETGCNQQSHARVYGVEKHGYTKPVEVPWP